MLHKILKFGIVFVLVGIFSSVFWPSPSFQVAPLTDISYQGAIESVNANNTSYIDKVNPDCASKLFVHGQKQPKSILIYHGFTNCPKQFEVLGQLLYELGYNVYIPRIPYHGYSDTMTNEFQKLTSQDLISSMQQNYEIAIGLGNSVDVMGISAGANLAVWTGFNYGASQVLAIAPLFAPTTYQDWQIPIMHNYIALLPNENKWWDDVAQDKSKDGPLHAYPRYSSKAANAFLEISLDLKQKIFQSNSNIQSNTSYKLLTLENDQAVNNSVALKYFNLLQKTTNHKIYNRELPSNSNLNHDIIDPLQPRANTNYVYPIILEMLSSD